MAKPIYIIEHLEPQVWPWCVIEYKHISETVGKENLWITNLKDGCKELEGYAKLISPSVKELNLDLKKVCILDPDATSTLSPQDSELFDYFVFGGILGDHPPKKRTGPELTQFLPGASKRDILKEQMSTDNAVFTVHTILNGTPIDKMKFQDGIEVKINDIESIDFPFRYALVNGKPFISKELIKYLKAKQDF
jgi:ribosome biogenesis SPOUT family RNA methylase Rps3